MSPTKARRQAGLSLIEVAVTLCIGALLAAAGVPQLADYVANARLREAGNGALAEALFAQSEAIKRNAVVRLEIEGNGLRVLERARDGGEDVVLRSSALPDGVSAAAATRIDFGSAGWTTPLGAAYSVAFEKAGVSCSEYRCPALTVGAGGAVRLCADRNACS
jgi:type IV fimbrial biogenesis protein FimT